MQQVRQRQVAKGGRGPGKWGRHNNERAGARVRQVVVGWGRHVWGRRRWGRQAAGRPHMAQVKAGRQARGRHMVGKVGGEVAGR